MEVDAGVCVAVCMEQKAGGAWLKEASSRHIEGGLGQSFQSARVVVQ